MRLYLPSLGSSCSSTNNRLNSWLGLGNGFLSAGAEIFVQSDVVMTCFASLSTGSVLLIGLAAVAIALLIGWLRGSPILFTVVFALNGVYNASVGLAHTNFLLDVAPSGDRPTCCGTANTLAGVGILASSGGGALVDWLGYPALLASTLLLLSVAAGIVVTIRDPRAEMIGTSLS
jgi:hypothetical protein